MWSPRHALVTIFLGLLAGSLLIGCRAFEPEAIIVNRLPETYIVGSPAETSGAYFHFHVYWYGTDEDGFVDRYVWALTDTSVQDPETDDDEEDQRFNPATNISTLEIGNYTTRTDTVFDFRIGQGANLSYDMTLHMVAVDDRGDFDRTPARLHFFSNALGNPEVDFYRDEVGAGNEFSDFDTLAFREPLLLKWRGSTPNIRAYDPVLLAERDTVPPDDDGLLGFKWRLPEFDDCNDAEDDCWNPRAFDEASGDSFSFFGPVTELNFRNDGTGDGVFGEVLDAGTIELLVNTIDVAGVEVPTTDQVLHIVVNYDPDTRILRGETDPYHNDPLTYPYYTVFHGPEAGDYTFSEGDTVPDRAYVTFKAVGWDDPRDSILDYGTGVSFQGQFIAGNNIRGEGIYFEFSTSYSLPHQTPEWTITDPELYDDDPWDTPSSDTLGFEVGPFDYDVVMRSVDEQGTRDGTPDTFSFVGNYAPCVQTVEIGSVAYEPETVYEDPCWQEAQLSDQTQLQLYVDDRYDPADPMHLRSINVGGTPEFGNIWVQPASGAITYEEPLRPDEWTAIPANSFYYVVYLNGKDHVQEHWEEGEADRRVMAWRYQVDYAADTGNAIADGGGVDNITSLTGFDVQTAVPADPLQSDLFIDPDTGIWGVRVKIGIPIYFTAPGGAASYWGALLSSFGAPAFDPGWTEEEILAWQQDPAVIQAFRAWKLTLMPFSPGTVRAIAADASNCEWRSQTSNYHYYVGTRIPEDNSRACEAYQPQGDGPQEAGRIDLVDFIRYSTSIEEAPEKQFLLNLYLAGEDTATTADRNPPNWIETGKRLSLR
jgi:hypothetical protein